jgi:sugar O-acyltransferase (sialic acid O-acetyltransferase NeuD family)
MEKIVIVGAGALAAEVARFILDSNIKKNSNDYTIVGFLDDNKESYDKYSLHSPFLGPIFSYKPKDDEKLILAIADIPTRRKVISYFTMVGGVFTNFIHPWSIIFDTARMGTGNVIMPYTLIGPNADLGDYNLVNSRVVLGHDTQIGTNNTFFPSTGISGSTTIGDNNLFGVNSATLPGISIGSNNKISAGMVIERKLKSDMIVFHRFKERVIAYPQQ